jgi:hypothetical protein
MNGTLTLGDVAARASHLEVACSRCDRHGRYQLARLVAALGADFRLTDLGSEIANCPRRAAAVHERCDIYFPGLKSLMDGEAGRPSAEA